MKGAFFALLACVVACGLATGASGALPNGTTIEATIDQPAGGTTFASGADVPLTGTASLGTTVADTTVVYVVDVSGSTFEQTGLCPNENVYDRTPNTTLDCEIQAVAAVNRKAASMDSVAAVAAIGFGGSRTGMQAGPFRRYAGSSADAGVLDLSPAAGGQPLVPAGAHTLNPTLPIWGSPPMTPPQSDLEWALTSAYTYNSVTALPQWPVPLVNGSGYFDQDGFTEFTPVHFDGNTNYWAAIDALHRLAPQIATPRTVVVFLSDGNANIGGPNGEQVGSALTALLADPAVQTHFTFDAFAVGQGAQCSPALTQQENVGTLQDIANATTGGSCTAVSSTNAGTVVPNAIGSSLTGVSFTVDGSAATPDTTFSPPVSGPATQPWSRTFTGLADGPHTICATAAGTDAGGPGTSDPACIDVLLKPKPVIDLGSSGGSAGTVAEGTAFAVAPTVTGATSTHWVAAPVAAPGAEGSCSFADANALATTVTCTDEGDYVLTLTADDGVNAPQSASETLTVTNVAPSLTLTSPTAGSSGRTVTFAATVTDPGAGPLSCTVHWGDGETSAPDVVGTTCTATHVYAADLAAATISAFASDDDGASSPTSTATLTFNRPPVCSAVTASPSTLWPANGKLVLVRLGGAFDPDSDAVSYRIDGVTQDEAGAGAQPASGGSVYLRAQRDGRGDGRVYTIAFTATDTHGASCSGTVDVGVPHDQGVRAVKSHASFEALG